MRYYLNSIKGKNNWCLDFRYRIWFFEDIDLSRMIFFCIFFSSRLWYSSCQAPVESVFSESLPSCVQNISCWTHKMNARDLGNSKYYYLLEDLWWHQQFFGLPTFQTKRYCIEHNIEQIQKANRHKWRKIMLFYSRAIQWERAVGSAS